MRTLLWDRSIVETALEYELLKFLSLGASYRFTANKRETKDTEYLHRYTLNTTLKKKINRFTPSFRILYANYSDEEDYKEILRLKGKIKYNIPRNKITPFIAAEAF
jgi:isopentenyldiphosphate isomerase